ncbi:MAG: acyl carrier protein [Pseudonocardiales bacterium]|nr:acyl carrier protein [Pseudonocardiales bacterium]
MDEARLADVLRTVGAIIEQVHGHPVGPAVNFFEAGLTSLKLVQIFDLVCDELGVVLEPSILFTYPTLGSFAAYLSDARSLSIASVTSPRAEQRRGRSAGARREFRRGVRRDGLTR